MWWEERVLSKCSMTKITNLAQTSLRFHGVKLSDVAAVAMFAVIVAALAAFPIHGLAAASGPADSDLAARLCAEDSAVRLAAVQEALEIAAVGDGIDPAVVPILVDRLADSETRIADAAEMVLWHIGDAALEELSDGLSRYRDAQFLLVRVSIAQIMGRIGPTAVTYLVSALDDSMPEVRRAAMQSLQSIGEQALPASQAVSEALLDVEEDATVRMAAASALGAMRASDETSLLALVLARADTNLRIALAADRALTSLQPTTLDLISALLSSAGDSGLTLQAREALAWVADRASDFSEVTVEYLRTADAPLRARFAYEMQHLYGRLDSIRAATAVAIIELLLEDEDEAVRAAAVSSLADLDQSAIDLIPVLSSIALDPDTGAEARRATMSGWERIGRSTPADASELISLASAEDEDEDIRGSAVRILAAIDGPTKDVADMILDNLPALREEWQWRLAPVIVEAGRTDSGVVDRLVECLDGTTPTGSSIDRLYAIRVLSAIGREAESSLPALIEALSTEQDPLHRKAIARALAEIAGGSNTQVEAVLLSLIDDADSDIRRIARSSLGLSTETSPVGPIPAFPGAEGFGMWTVGGRGGRVYVVTNLNDSGPGSLREAVEASGPRIVVFAVSGTIHLKSRLRITNPFITIAGQTAPGDGITLADYDLMISTNDVILRYVRVRLGDRTRVESDAVWIDSSRNVIVDHVSSSWSVDECLSVSGSDNVTVQWCFITESMQYSVHSKGAHGYGSLVRGEFGSRYSFHHNLWAHHSGRMPRPGNYTAASIDKEGALIDFRNNVFYNWGRDYSGANHDTNSITMYNFINNYYKRGPNSTGSIAFREECPYAKAYFAGNMMNGVEPRDPWSLVDARINRTIYQDSYKQSEPFRVADIETEPADVAYERVLASAGMHPRDDVDARIVDEVIHGRGRIIDSQNDVGGWPMLRSEAPARDTNGDSVPDWWCVMYGLDPREYLDLAGDLDGDGYTNIEEYLNGTDPDQREDLSTH